jgi:hypothetical protein
MNNPSDLASLANALCQLVLGAFACVILFGTIWLCVRIRRGAR